VTLAGLDTAVGIEREVRSDELADHEFLA